MNINMVSAILTSLTALSLLETDVMERKLDLLNICYNALLNRDPDEVAKANWAASENGMTALHGLLKSIISSPEFFVKQKDAYNPFEENDLRRFFNEQSQFGEVGRLIRQIVNTAATQKIVVDVGANGRERSNSYDLLRFFGWHGLLIEANPQRNPIIEEGFAGLDYHLINCAVSDYTGEAAFHLGINDDVSSLREETAVGWGPVRGVTSVIVRPLSSILSEYNIPLDFDLLSIDAEGEDIRILNETIEKGYRPCWIILEAVHDQIAPSFDLLGFTKLVCTTYSIVDSTAANLILRRSDIVETL